MPESAVRESVELPVLPLADEVVLPGMVAPIMLDQETKAAVDAAQSAADSRLLLVPRIDGAYGTHGVLAVIDQVGRLPERRARRRRSRPAAGPDRRGVTGAGAALWVQATPIDDIDADRPHPRAGVVVQGARGLDPATARRLAGHRQRAADERPVRAERHRRLRAVPRRRAEALAARQPAMSTSGWSELIEWGRNHLAELEVSEQIRDDVREGMEKTQREFLLRQQLAAIRKELGEDEPDGADDYRTRVEQADLPDKVREAAMREVGKLERSSDQSPEGGWIRTWLDTVLELPWTTRTTDNTDVTAARAVLDADHEGLEDVKDRIVEHLAVRARRAERGLEVVGGRGSGAVLALVGPPGVGKTSMGESVARALGRNFVRVALGGVRDEAEIRGHRRTYVGALPGRIVRAIRESGSMNPVVLLDEVDKLGTDFRGDPASALLEVLDPAQNHTFRDHYLELELDLSDVLFLATANVADTIPDALLDRMEVVRLDGYTEDEKVAIARNHLLPRQLSRAALDADEVEVDDDALRLIAGEHTREAGVRQLERAIARVLRKVATALAADPSRRCPSRSPRTRWSATSAVPTSLPESAERTAVPGVATGLAVTGAGGDVLFVEATAMPGDAHLTLTGQLGDVMKESAHIALSYLKAHGDELGIDPAALEQSLHVHVPAGAVPKDGPSAGVTMVTALASLVTGRPVRSDVGMTGEVTLNGRVLPIGGVKQKLLAAHRAGLTTVFLPKRNEADLDDVPEAVREQLDVRLVADVADLVREALEPTASTTLAA